ncbi:hypothetical protein QAD02_016312 [Eretmocerus hayati]|uniref:Uncharacterized protein n=1 Tax=Eretmocerus hayati TaxID=131215 RepID=A0ACC2PAU1_9HYME|nr:hypothetical protein QAD02_016312 [Eretmocerus hayati]
MSITGITNDSAHILGSIKITFFDKPIKFQVISSTLPINAASILAIDFLKKESAELSLYHNALMTTSRPLKPMPFLNQSSESSQAYQRGMISPTKDILKAKTRTHIEFNLEPTGLKNRILASR